MTAFERSNITRITAESDRDDACQYEHCRARRWWPQARQTTPARRTPSPRRASASRENHDTWPQHGLNAIQGGQRSSPMVVAQFVTGEACLPIQRCQLPDRCRVDRRCRHHTFDVLRRRLSRVHAATPLRRHRVRAASNRRRSRCVGYRQPSAMRAASTSTASSRSATSGSAVTCRSVAHAHRAACGLDHLPVLTSDTARLTTRTITHYSEELKDRLAHNCSGRHDQAAPSPAVRPFQVGRRRRWTMDLRPLVV